MRLAIALLPLLTLALSARAQTSGGDNILGVWLSEKKDGKIEVYKVGLG